MCAVCDVVLCEVWENTVGSSGQGAWNRSIGEIQRKCQIPVEPREMSRCLLGTGYGRVGHIVGWPILWDWSRIVDSGPCRAGCVMEMGK